MVEDAAQDIMPEASPAEPGSRRRQGRRIARWAAIAMLVFLLAALAIAWLARERIAGDIITDLLNDRRLLATYEIESIGPREQVLRNVVVGDPARPDLTIERVVVELEPRLGTPALDNVRLIRPRLYGSYRDGRLSFGSLDPLLFTGSGEPFSLPDLRLAIEDGRGLMETDMGRVGISLQGGGWLRGGFAGELAATAPALAVAGCSATNATLYGRVAIENARPRFAGPLRLARLGCPANGLALAGIAAPLELTADQAMDGVEGTMQVATGAGSLPQARMNSARGKVDFTWRDNGLTARYQMSGQGLRAGQVQLASLALDGSLRTRQGLTRIELDGDASATGLAPGPALDSTLASLEGSTRGTLLQPIVARIRQTIAREAPGSRLAAELIARRNGEQATLVVPTARLTGTSGATLLQVSRFQLAAGDGEPLRWSGNVATGGALPRITGRMEQAPGGGLELVAAMSPYRAGPAQLAIPRLSLTQARNGTLGFTGTVNASGPLPEGRARGLIVPVDGKWSRASGLAMWQGCTQLRFDQLAYASLTLDRRQLTLCPPRGQPMLRLSPGGALSIAAGAPSLELVGRLGETRIALDSGPVGFAWPGTVTARQVNVALGPPETATRFALTDLTASLGSEITGTFAGTDVLLNAVPLDVHEAGGTWRYSGGVLTLAEAGFRLEDRGAPDAAVDRFEPMVARDATLTLADNRITANAILRQPTSDREVTRVAIVHDLGNASGHADLAVDALVFDGALQPTQLTQLALGVIANAAGTVTGTGRIDWNEAAVTSTGTFATTDLDFAAAFGPVTGAAGTITFTDLLGLTTAPDQQLTVATINPGIEVTDGVVQYELHNGEALVVEGGRWPFLGGTLAMQPVTINFGVAEERRYVFEISGLDAGAFVQRLGLANLSATGSFDGTIPIVFDADGNGSLQGGLLLSRAPGGNVSYVGELTYEDLSPVANFAFDALRSLNYEQMSIQMDGSLSGEIVTRVGFDGISQGEGASSNIITRQLARLPLRFVVNVRAPFYSLIGSVRALYDPTAIRDPRELGLLDHGGRPLDPSVSIENADGTAAIPVNPIQPPASETEP